MLHKKYETELHIAGKAKSLNKFPVLKCSECFCILYPGCCCCVLFLSIVCVMRLCVCRCVCKYSHLAVITCYMWRMCDSEIKTEEESCCFF